MKRHLSSRLTIFIKVFVCIFISSMWLMGFVSFFTERQTEPPFKFVMLGVAVVSTLIFYFVGLRYKQVSVDEDFLYVSNFFREISIPLAQISDVTEIKLRGRPLTVHLEITSEFGSKITFLPNQGITFFRSHPFVAELKEMAVRAKNRV